MKYLTTALASTAYGIHTFFDDHLWNIETTLQQIEKGFTNEHAWYWGMIDYIGFSLNCIESICRLSSDNDDTRLNAIDSLIQRLTSFRWPLKFSSVVRDSN